jgi:hypothetical protein
MARAACDYRTRRCGEGGGSNADDEHDAEGNALGITLLDIRNIGKMPAAGQGVGRCV